MGYLSSKDGEGYRLSGSFAESTQADAYRHAAARSRLLSLLRRDMMGDLFVQWEVESGFLTQMRAWGRHNRTAANHLTSAWSEPPAQSDIEKWLRISVSADANKLVRDLAEAFVTEVARRAEIAKGNRKMFAGLRTEPMRWLAEELVAVFRLGSFAALIGRGISTALEVDQRDPDASRWRNDSEQSIQRKVGLWVQFVLVGQSLGELAHAINPDNWRDARKQIVLEVLDADRILHLGDSIT